MNRRVFLLQSSAGLLLGCIRPALRLDSESRQLICIPDVLGPLGEVPQTLATLGREYLLWLPRRVQILHPVHLVLQVIDLREHEPPVR